MLKEKAIRGVAVGSIPHAQPQEDGMARLVTTVVCVGLGLVIPQGTIYGSMAPFGVSLAAAVSGTHFFSQRHTIEE